VETHSCDAGDADFIDYFSVVSQNVRDALRSWAAPDKHSVTVAAGLPVAFRNYDLIPSAVSAVLRHVCAAPDCRVVRQVPLKTFASMCRGTADLSWLSEGAEDELGNYAFVVPTLDAAAAEVPTGGEQSTAGGGKKRMSKAARKRLKNSSNAGTTGSVQKNTETEAMTGDQSVFPTGLNIQPVLVYGISEDNATLLTSEELRESCCFASNY